MLLLSVKVAQHVAILPRCLGTLGVLSSSHILSRGGQSDGPHAAVVLRAVVALTPSVSARLGTGPQASWFVSKTPGY